jgi:hypothetical protein
VRTVLTNERGECRENGGEVVGGERRAIGIVAEQRIGRGRVGRVGAGIGGGAGIGAGGAALALAACRRAARLASLAFGARPAASRCAVAMQCQYVLLSSALRARAAGAAQPHWRSTRAAYR